MPFVHRRLRRLVCGAALALLTGGGALAEAGKTAAQFSVRLGGIGVGVFWIDGSTSRRAYTTTAGFRSTGLIGEFAKVRVGFTARGQIRNGQFYPDAYSEEVVTSRRRTALSMTYRNGVPTVRGEKEDDASNPVDAATQKDTLDPLTGVFVMLRDQPRDGVCQIDRFAFDGERSTRVDMTTLSREGDDLLCRGQFRRLDGYSDTERRRSGVVDVSVRYRVVEDTAIAVEARFSSLRGSLRLTRR